MITLESLIYLFIYLLFIYLFIYLNVHSESKKDTGIKRGYSSSPYTVVIVHSMYRLKFRGWETHM